jgi:hypothetical protein
MSVMVRISHTEVMASPAVAQRCWIGSSCALRSLLVLRRRFVLTGDGFTAQHRVIGRATAWAAAVLLVAYVITTVLGLLSLESSDEPIGDPYFTLMELLIILIAPLLVVAMVAVHAYAAPEDKVYGALGLAFMVVLAGLTTSLHFVVLTVSDRLEETGESWTPLVTGFEWPSVVYALDILAWDWFFALAIICAAPVFKANRLERQLRRLMVVCGVLSFAGLLGVPLENMVVRDIGVVGYAVLTPIVFLMLGVVFGRAHEDSRTTLVASPTARDGNTTANRLQQLTRP